MAQDTGAPLLDLHARSREVVQALGPVQSMRFAQVAPPSSLVAAAQTGTTVDADAAPPPASIGADDIGPPLAQPKPSFDYTHLGDRGAEVFGAIVADELSRVVPELRGRLIP